ncbi:MAG: hypothetical protein M1820_001399 [Bogoriella megaspora]|nr:MAG: hypothetical protein M1820_001399 [Bogoriella megaspora]
MFSKAPWNKDKETSKDDQQQDESLTTILEPEERSELTLLIANATESIRQNLLDTFDPKQTGATDQNPNDPKSGTKDAFEITDPATADVEASERQRKDEAAREKELAAPAVQELKKEALDFFDEWRDAVLQRVGEVVNSREKAKEQQKEVEEQQQAPKLPPRKPVANLYGESVQKALHQLYPPIETPLKELKKEKRALILHSLILLMLSLERYAAHSRILLLYMVTSLDLTVVFLAGEESKIARGLLEAANQMSADEETKKKQEENATARKWKVGLASVAGAAIIGVTGGLAAPFLAAGIGTVMGGLGLGATAAAGYLGTMASSAVLVGGLFGAYGGKMTGKMMDKYAKEVEDFGFVPVRENHKPRKLDKEYRRLRVAIGISGWLTEQKEVVEPWKVIGRSEEAFALRYELEALLNLGNAMSTMVRSAAWNLAAKEIVKRTVFGALSAGLWPLGLLKVSRVLDNPFSVAKARADKAGEVLADALINKAQGERPVTLVGYSLGARVIYTCLMALAERKAFGLLESVILIGAPAPATSLDWRKMRSVVAGRVVNVYYPDDYILGFLYRGSSIQLGVAGLQKIDGVKGIENVDVSGKVTGHTRYRFLCGSILKDIGFEDLEPEEVAREERAAEEDQKKEEAERENAEKESGKSEEEQAEDMEKKVDEKTKQSMMGWTAEKLRAGGSSASEAFSKARSQVFGRSSGEKSRSGSQSPMQTPSAASEPAQGCPPSTS